MEVEPNEYAQIARFLFYFTVLSFVAFVIIVLFGLSRFAGLLR